MKSIARRLCVKIIDAVDAVELSMKLFTKLVLITCFAFFNERHGFCQSDLSVSVFAGPIYYNGDLSDDRIIPPLQLMNLHYGIEGTVMLTDRVEVGIGFFRGTLEGDDALSNDKFKRLRNLSFSTTNYEAFMKFRLEIFKTVDFRPVNTALILGAGVISFNPTGELDGEKIDLQPLGTEGQFIETGNYPQPYKLTSTVLMVGIGARISLSSRMALLLDLTPRITFTDYLDDVSGFYPDSTQLANSPGGMSAVLLSHQGSDNFPKEGRARGNPSNNDVYIAGGISFRYYFGKTYHSGSKPGIFRKIRESGGGWWGDRP
ncbi:MAG: hypothetical protein ACK5C5_09345 [Bacteroidota bacterium]|jgi:hypothetical protein